MPELSSFLNFLFAAFSHSYANRAHPASRGGRLGGLLAMAVSTLIWSAVSAASFEFARAFGAYDYRAFFTNLLGRGWIAYEICYVALLAIILAVIAAAGALAPPTSSTMRPVVVPLSSKSIPAATMIGVAIEFEMSSTKTIFFEKVTISW